MKSEEEVFISLVPLFTQNIVAKNLPFMIAPGSSASELAKEMQASAFCQSLKLPEIFTLSRKESRDMYFDHNDNPILVIKDLLIHAGVFNLESLVTVNFLDDYTFIGTKVAQMDMNLSKTSFKYSFQFFYQIMFSASPVNKKNVDVFRQDLSVARWRDKKFNSEQKRNRFYTPGA